MDYGEPCSTPGTPGTPGTARTLHPAPFPARQPSRKAKGVTWQGAKGAVRVLRRPKVRCRGAGHGAVQGPDKVRAPHGVGRVHIRGALAGPPRAIGAERVLRQGAASLGFSRGCTLPQRSVGTGGPYTRITAIVDLLLTYPALVSVLTRRLVEYGHYCITLRHKTPAGSRCRPG